jgi:hypothetical protein
MRPPRLKPVTHSPQLDLRTIQVTGCELIVIQAALPHYLDFLRSSNPALYQQAAPMIKSFVLRLHDQLPPGPGQITGDAYH